MKNFRKAVFWLHLCLGVTGGVVIFIMCITGAALAFEKNIIEAFEADQRRVTPAGGRIEPRDVLSTVVGTRPRATPTGILFSSDPTAAVAINLGREGQVFVDPYRGSVTGEGNRSVRAFFGLMTDLHRWLALPGDGRPWGKAVTGACNLMFLGLAVTGIYIWFPTRLTWKHIRPVTWFRRGISGRARDFNWHNTIGFWTSVALIVLTVTASVISYSWASDLIYTLTGNEVPRANAPAPTKDGSQEQLLTIPDNFDDLWKTAESVSPGWRSISLRLPVGKEAVFTIDEGKSLNPFGRGTLTVDPVTAQPAKWEPYTEKNAAVQIRSWFRFTHTGESFGLVGQLVGFIACIGGAFLVYTGVSLAFRRLSGYLRGRSA